MIIEAKRKSFIKMCAAFGIIQMFGSWNLLVKFQLSGTELFVHDRGAIENYVTPEE